MASREFAEQLQTRRFEEVKALFASVIKKARILQKGLDKEKRSTDDFAYMIGELLEIQEHFQNYSKEKTVAAPRENNFEYFKALARNVMVSVSNLYKELVKGGYTTDDLGYVKGILRDLNNRLSGYDTIKEGRTPVVRTNRVRSIINKFSGNILTIEDVEAFFAALTNQLGIDFHPEDSFYDYIDNNGHMTFSPADATDLDEIMSNCDDVCSSKGLDVNQVALDTVNNNKSNPPADDDASQVEDEQPLEEEDEPDYSDEDNEHENSQQVDDFIYNLKTAAAGNPNALIKKAQELSQNFSLDFMEYLIDVLEQNNYRAAAAGVKQSFEQRSKSEEYNHFKDKIDMNSRLNSSNFNESEFDDFDTQQQPEEQDVEDYGDMDQEPVSQDVIDELEHFIKQVKINALRNQNNINDEAGAAFAQSSGYSKEELAEFLKVLKDHGGFDQIVKGITEAMSDDGSNDEAPMCHACNGTGEGPASGTSCRSCGGSGVEDVRNTYQDY